MHSARWRRWSRHSAASCGTSSLANSVASVQRLVAAPALALAQVAAGVRHQAVEPRLEPGLPPKLADAGAKLGERLLGGVLRVLLIREQVPGQPPHALRVALDQRLQRAIVAVLGADRKHQIRQACIRRLVTYPISED